MGKQIEWVVCSGSREWTDYDFVAWRLQQLAGNMRVRVGDARGADHHVRHACRNIGIQCVEFEADWKAAPRAAGVLRNEVMFATDPAPVHFIAFWIGNTGGTRDAVRRAYQHAVPWIEIHRRPE